MMIPLLCCYLYFSNCALYSLPHSLISEKLILLTQLLSVRTEVMFGIVLVDWVQCITRDLLSEWSKVLLALLCKLSYVLCVICLQLWRDAIGL